MARDPYIEQRLENWGRWARGDRSGGLGFAGTNWAAFDDSDRSGPAPVMPEGEEAITDMAVRSLEPDQAAVLVMQYVEGGTLERKCDRLGVHKTTYLRRRQQAERGVDAWLAERVRRQREERERVERLQREAKR